MFRSHIQLCKLLLLWKPFSSGTTIYIGPCELTPGMQTVRGIKKRRCRSQSLSKQDYNAMPVVLETCFDMKEEWSFPLNNLIYSSTSSPVWDYKPLATPLWWLLARIHVSNYKFIATCTAPHFEGSEWVTINARVHAYGYTSAGTPPNTNGVHLQWSSLYSCYFNTVVLKLWSPLHETIFSCFHDGIRSHFLFNPPMNPMPQPSWLESILLSCAFHSQRILADKHILSCTTNCSCLIPRYYSLFNFLKNVSLAETQPQHNKQP